jgi:hypothetical protein
LNKSRRLRMVFIRIKRAWFEMIGSVYLWFQSRNKVVSYRGGNESGSKNSKIYFAPSRRV